MAASLEGAIEYLSARLNSGDFTDADETTQRQALTSASDVIARNTPSDATETDIECATYEQAVWMLGADASMQANGVKSFGLDDISEAYRDKLGRPAELAPNAYKILTEGVDGSRGGGLVVRKLWL